MSDIWQKGTPFTFVLFHSHSSAKSFLTFGQETTIINIREWALPPPLNIIEVLQMDAVPQKRKGFEGIVMHHCAIAAHKHFVAHSPQQRSRVFASCSPAQLNLDTPIYSLM